MTMPQPIYDYDEFRRLYEAGCSDPEIARQCGCMIGVVYRWRHKAGLPAHQQHRRGLKQAVAKLAARGLQADEIARRLDCHHAYVRATIARLNKPGRDAGYSRNYRAEHNRLIGR